MSRLVELDPEIFQNSESEGQEYRCCTFEELHSISTAQKVPQEANMTVNEVNTSSADSSKYMKLGMMHRGLCKVQQQDHFCKRTLDHR